MDSYLEKISNLADLSNLDSDRSLDTGLGERGRVLSGVGDLLSMFLQPHHQGPTPGQGMTKTSHQVDIMVGAGLQQATGDPCLVGDSWTLRGKSGSVFCGITAPFS